MRNLKNIKHAVIDLAADEQPLRATAWDTSNDSLICAFGPSEASPALTLKRLDKDACNAENATTIASWDALSPNPDLPVDSVLDLHYFPDTQTSCLTLAGGDLIVVREEVLPGEDLIEIVGSVDAGITAAAWSPDEELLAITTKADTLLVMTRNFESTVNTALSPEDVKASSHVSVGWGRSETQFKGRGTKALRDPTVPEHVDEGTLSLHDDGTTTISWRGDAAYFAVNSVLDAELSRRIIRVYSREGALCSVSEPINGLEAALSWKPSGQLIAGIQRRADRIDVVFFERNGLRHGEFDLRLTKEQMDGVESVIRLQWNADSSVLAVAMRNRVQLWIVGNYYWYLKQEIKINAKVGRTTAIPISWHPEKPLHLIVGAGYALQALSFSFATANGSNVPPNDIGLMAVIDGRHLKVTPLRVANVPPPMAHEDIELPCGAVDVSISPSGQGIAVLHSDSVSIWSCNYSRRPRRPSTLVKMIHLAPAIHEGASSSTLVYKQICFLNNDDVVVLSAVTNGSKSILKSLFSESRYEAQSSEVLPCPVIMLSRMDHQRVCYETADGSVHAIGLCNDTEGRYKLGQLPVVCPEMQIWSCEAYHLVFGLSSTGTLHIGSDSQKLHLPACTSFLVTQAHLIYTTTSHLLKFVHLHTGELDVPPDEPEKDERCRNIEHAARLVTVMPSACSLVLQMPRGNLETIYPRALVLAGIRESITAQDWLTALLACRTHRVDMNILHDYAPEQFMVNVPWFIEQIKKAEYIDLFLSQLSEENVVETLYKETLVALKDDTLAGRVNDHDTLDPSQIKKSKVNRICDAFLDFLQSRPSSSVQNQITAHISKIPPDLEAGLQLVAKLAVHQSDQLEEAVQHICFLGDVNQLYDAALGLYDLEVALLVAQQSQKDPREYLPYLQGLQDMETNRKRFTVDNDLKRHRKALGHLYAMNAFNELKPYTEKHDLYSAAMNLYRYDNARLDELTRLYADYLVGRNIYKEAGIAYEYLQDYPLAREAYRSAGLWRECLAAATLVPTSNEELSSLATDLAEGLMEAKNFSDAAVVQIEYLHDLETAVKLLCKAYQFVEAIRIIGLHGRSELLKAAIDPGLVEGSASMTDVLAEMKSQLNAQVPRLQQLRQKKDDDPIGFLDGAAGDAADMTDTMSLAPTDASTSGGTFMTRYTTRSMGTLASNATRQTSKNRRREERKRARGKKGTVYEEEYLVNSIRRLIERINTISDEVTRLVEGLLRRAMRERALAVEGAMLGVTEVARGCISEVFQPQQELHTGHEAQQQPNGEPLARPWGGQGVLWDAIAESSQRQEPPIIKEFVRLSILS